MKHTTEDLINIIETEVSRSQHDVTSGQDFYALMRQRAMLVAEKLARDKRDLAAMKALEKEADELRLKGKLEKKVTK